MFKIAAHRGGNNKESLKKAILQGFDYVELDVHLSNDGVVLVQYLPYIEIDGNKISIANINYNTLNSNIQEGLFTLEEALLLAKGSLGIVVDVKKGKDFYSNIGTIVADLIKKNDMIDSTWIISFDHVCLNDAKNACPNIKIAPMYVAHPYNEVFYWKSMFSDGVEICNDYLTEQIAELAHANNLVLIGWCTKDYQELDWLVDIGIDIITIEQDDSYINYIFQKRDKICSL